MHGEWVHTVNAQSYDSADTAYRQFNGCCLDLKEAIEGVSALQRRLYPSEPSEQIHDLAALKSSLDKTKIILQEMVVPDPLLEPLETVIELTKRLLDSLETILAVLKTGSGDIITHMMRASRRICRTQEKLYPLREMSSDLDRLFLEGTVAYRDKAPQPQSPEGIPTGLNHVGSEDDDYARGAFSYYVPESYDSSREWPLVVALHGGSGHGRDYIWTWLREARSRGFILLSPTAVGRTWSLREPQIDGERLFSVLDLMERNYRLDMNRILLTGMSDGGTFALICCLQDRTPFTAFAPVAGVLPSTDTTHTRDRRVYWVHGAYDQMFPLYLAQNGSEMLENAGADITFRPIGDLAHTYPREENDRILRWFDPSMPWPA